MLKVQGPRRSYWDQYAVRSHERAFLGKQRASVRTCWHPACAESSSTSACFRTRTRLLSAPAASRVSARFRRSQCDNPPHDPRTHPNGDVKCRVKKKYPMEEGDLTEEQWAAWDGILFPSDYLPSYRDHYCPARVPPVPVLSSNSGREPEETNSFPKRRTPLFRGTNSFDVSTRRGGRGGAGHEQVHEEELRAITERMNADLNVATFRAINDDLTDGIFRIQGCTTTLRARCVGSRGGHSRSTVSGCSDRSPRHTGSADGISAGICAGISAGTCGNLCGTLQDLYATWFPSISLPGTITTAATTAAATATATPPGSPTHPMTSP